MRGGVQLDQAECPDEGRFELQIADPSRCPGRATSPVPPAPGENHPRICSSPATRTSRRIIIPRTITTSGLHPNNWCRSLGPFDLRLSRKTEMELTPTSLSMTAAALASKPAGQRCAGCFGNDDHDYNCCVSGPRPAQSGHAHRHRRWPAMEARHFSSPATHGRRPMPRRGS